MKVKIRGLVFVGFAAAVFAQSAMADANDAKTVTSKLYVDTKFQTKENIVTTTEAGANGFDWTSETTYPSVALLNQVKSQVSGIDVNGDSAYISVADNNGVFTVSPLNAPATASSELVGTVTNPTKFVTAGAVNGLIDTAAISSSSDATHLPTSQAVYNYAEATANKLAETTRGTTTITQAIAEGADGNTKFPTVQNVYDFVTDAIGDNNIAVAGDGTYLQANWNADNRTWTVSPKETVVTAASGVVAANDGNLITSGAVRDYAEAKTNKLASTTPISSSSDDVQYPSAKNVYDFVNGNYQAKAAANTTTVQVGYNGGWGTLGGSTYVTVDPNGGSGTVSLTNLTAATTDFVASTDANATTNRPKLAKAGDVYDFVMAQTNGLVIPEMPEACTTAAASGHYCALVYGNTAAANETPVYGLQWTIMAPAS